VVNESSDPTTKIVGGVNNLLGGRLGRTLFLENMRIESVKMARA